MQAVLSRASPFSGLLFVALLVGGFVALGMVGAEDGSPAEAFQAALVERGHFAQIAGMLHALAGAALAAFVWELRCGRLASPDSFAPWGVWAGFAWAATFVLGGILLFSSAELAGYQDHAGGAKTMLLVGHLAYANPLGAVFGAGLALAVGLARPPAFPRWFRPASFALAGVGLATAILGGFGGIGLLGLGPVALWVVLAAVLAAWRGATS